MSALRFHLLGPLEARRDGAVLDLGPRKQRAVLALLLLNANRVVPTERLIDDLWGESPPRPPAPRSRSTSPGSARRLGRRSRAADGLARLRARRRAGFARSRPLQEPRAPRRARRPIARARRSCCTARWRCGGASRSPTSAASLSRRRRRRSWSKLRLGALQERIDADLALGRARTASARAERSRRRAPLPRAVPRSADARALPRRPAGRCARRVPGGARGLHGRPRARAGARPEGARAGGARAGSGARRAGRAAADGRGTAAATGRPWILAAALGVLAVAAVVAAAVLLREESTITVPPNSLAVIDPATNDVTGVVPVGAGPGPIAAGGGSLWVGTLDKTLQRIDPDALAVAKTFSLGATPTGVAFGGDAAWAAHGLTGQVSRVDPQLEGVTKTKVAQTRLLSTGAVAYGPGAVWSVFGRRDVRADRPCHRRPRRVDLRPFAAVGGRRGRRVCLGSRASRTPWCTATPLPRSSKGRSAGRALEAARRQSRTVTASSGSPARATTWSLASTLGTTGRSRSPSATGPWPSRSARVPSGSRTRATGPSRASTPRRSEVVATIDVGQAPAGIAVGHGLVWVTVQAP